ncbi:MAG: energy transducer TonB [Arenimonas sp.]|nr:energy transducer TonB [Arenimonas sp.]MBP7916936.1 energy transducer TonB [Arenimonas sp.]
MNAIALAILLSALSGPVASVPSVSTPVPPAVTALAAKEATGEGRFELREGTQDDAWLTERFRESLWQLDVRLHEYKGQKPRSLEAYLRSPEYSTAKQMLALTGILHTGYATHTWVFDKPDTPGSMPARALEMEDLSGPDGYHVRATVHCYDEPLFCTPFRDRQTGLLAPKPAAAAGGLALQQWHNRIRTETCTVFARNMSHPRYPPQALRNGIGGTVRIGFRFNRCGNVRDAWVETSSGNRDLDRAALTQALKWQIDTTTLPEGKNTGRAVAPITFMPE